MRLVDADALDFYFCESVEECTEVLANAPTIDPERNRFFYNTSDVRVMGRSLNYVIELLYAEEQGRLIVLPCKVGDTVYEINTENPFEEDLRVMKSKIERFLIATNVDLHAFDGFGKTVFLSREEAERALKGENNGL